MTERAEKNLLSDFKKKYQWRKEFCKLVYRALAESPPDKYIEKAFSGTHPVLKQLRQGGQLRGYCFLEEVPGFNVIVLVLVTEHNYGRFPPEAFSDHAQGFVDDLRNLDSEKDARQYVSERAFTPKMWGNWMEKHGMENPHQE